MTSIEIALEVVEHQFETVSESPTDIPVARRVFYDQNKLKTSRFLLWQCLDDQNFD